MLYNKKIKKINLGLAPNPKNICDWRKKCDFTSNFNPFQWLNKTSNQQGHFLKKNIGLPFIFHMPRKWPKYLFLGQSNSSSYAKLFSADFWQRMGKKGLNCFIFSKTFNQKNMVTDFKFVVSNISYYFNMKWLPHWRSHGGSYVCEGVV